MGVRANNVLGTLITLADGRTAIRAKAHAALTAGKFYAVRPSRDTAVDITTGAAANDGIAVTAVPATLAVYHYLGVPERNFAINEIALLIVGGPTKAFVNTGNTATNFIKPTNASSDLTDDGATQTANSVGISCEANTSGAAALMNVQLLGLPAQV